jgi:very-short-patch-repair endonuclease
MLAKQKNNKRKISKQTIIPPQIWVYYRIPLPIPEYRFTMERKFRIDYAWPVQHVAVEIEGGIWIKGRHIQPGGFKKDMYKYNLLSEQGWFLLRYEPKNIDYMQIKHLIDLNTK